MNMKIAYFFLVYKNVEIVEKTILQLKNGVGHDDIYFLHIDKNSHENFSRLLSIPNVIFANKRFETKWGSPELAFAVVSGLKELVVSTEFDYVILLSESDYPVKTPEYIHTFLQNSNKDHILANPLPCNNPLSIPNCKWTEGGRRRINCYALRLNEKNISTIEPRTFNFNNIRQFIKVLRYNPPKIKKAINIFLNYPKRNHPSYLTPCGGHQWFILRRKTIEKLINYISQYPEYLEYCKDTQILDEILFPTLVYNLISNSKLSSDVLRFINWAGGNSPKALTEENIPLIKTCISSQNILFIRKIESIRITNTIDQLMSITNNKYKTSML